MNPVLTVRPTSVVGKILGNAVADKTLAQKAELVIENMRKMEEASQQAQQYAAFKERIKQRG